MRVQGILVLICCLVQGLFAQGPYAPGVDKISNKAIHMDSSLIVSWAGKVSIKRGHQDIANISLGKTSVGDSSEAMGKADFKVVSLGDGGEAIVQFEIGLFNGAGPDFVVFENAFNDSFLELAFVEVSSDGLNYFRFPAHSLTDTTVQIGSFGALDPTNVHNLAGKYRAGYGTPFDLEELKNQVGLNINKVTHIRLIDVVGSLDTLHLQRDHYGNPINEIYPTPFPSGGFDLDAVGAIHINPTGIQENRIAQLNISPNPVRDIVQLQGNWQGATYQIYTLTGQLKAEGIVKEAWIDLSAYESGAYLLRIQGPNKQAQVKLIKQ